MSQLVKEPISYGFDPGPGLMYPYKDIILNGTAIVVLNYVATWFAVTSNDSI